MDSPEKSIAPSGAGRWDSALRILILNQDLPIFPGRAGHEYLHTARLARLATRVGLVSLVHTREELEKTQCLADAGVDLYLWQGPNVGTGSPNSVARRKRARAIVKSTLYLFRSGLSRPSDTLIQDLQFRNISGPLLEALESRRWQGMIVVQSGNARWVDYIPPVPVSVVVMHDVRALVYERRARVARSVSERVGSFLEAWRYRHWERQYCSKYDLVVTVSASDEAWIRRHYRPRRIVTVPIPVDGDYFASMPAVPSAARRIVLTGMMDHPPNVDAACFFAREVLPRVQEAVPEAEFWIVGREPSLEVRALSTVPGVVVTGFVPDIRPYLAQATVVVVPLRFGSGMRNKILEAWAMRKCVASTHIGAEGLEYEDGVNILIADDAETMAAQVVQAIEDPVLRNRIGAKGRDLVISRHHPDKLADQYFEAIESVIHEKKRSPMRVVVDVRWMRPELAGGIENLSRSILRCLPRLDGFNRYTVIVPSEVRYDFDLRDRLNFRMIVADGPARYSQLLLWYGMSFVHRRLKVDYWRSAEVEKLRRVHALDAEVALSIPGYIHHDLYPLANVLIVPDIQHEYCPEFFSTHELEERRRIYTESIKRADHLCAISEFTRQTLIERLGVAPDRVTTTHLAADPIFHPENGYRRNTSQVLRTYGLVAGQYLFFPGNTWPHKNHRAALEALHILREADGLDPLLVCTGNVKGAHDDLMNTIHELRLEGQVRFLGYCSAEDMPALYEGAAALVFPSFFEGFGIPLVEAMWCDCPIICSNATSLPEIAGDAALLVDPRSSEELADAIKHVLTDAGLRRVLIERGRQQARKFSWFKFTREVVRILSQVREQCYG